MNFSFMVLQSQSQWFLKVIVLDCIINQGGTGLAIRTPFWVEIFNPPWPRNTMGAACQHGSCIVGRF